VWIWVYKVKVSDVPLAFQRVDEELLVIFNQVGQMQK